MTAEGDAALAALERRIGYTFKDRDCLLTALTHASALYDPRVPARADYQRLEFLGDRVLGLIVAEALLAAYPEEAEGDLAPRFNALVRRETLAEVAAELDLGAYLHLGRSEATGGGRRKKAILADAMEAVIAALWLDGGMTAARDFVLGRWQARIEAPAAAPMDAKTRLQEWAQGRGLALPGYAVAAREGPDHAPRFTVTARLETGETASGTASSKKQAEQAAAAALLARLGVPGGGDGGA